MMPQRWTIPVLMKEARVHPNASGGRNQNFFLLSVWHESICMLTKRISMVHDRGTITYEMHVCMCVCCGFCLHCAYVLFQGHLFVTIRTMHVLWGQPYGLSLVAMYVCCIRNQTVLLTENSPHHM